jgi:hypothetical protein
LAQREKDAVMDNPPKRVRREEEDWPSEEDTDRQLLSLLFDGKSPFEKWTPSRDLDQAVKIIHDVAWKRGWNFELRWTSYAGDIVIDEWEGRLVNFNIEAARRQDFGNMIEDYWATGKTAPMAICRVLLNLLDGVQEKEYIA